MKLRFTFSPQEIQGKQSAVKALILSICPDATVSIDEARAVLEVTVHGATEKIATAHLISEHVQKQVGVRLSFVDDAPYTPPLIQMPHAPRTVRLSVFIVSLICVILITSILTLTLTSACSLFKTNTLGTGEQQGEDYASKIALVDQIFEEYSIYDTNGQLLLDQMLKAYVAATGDSYAAYYNAEEFAAILADNRAEAVGIGIMVIEQSDGMLVVFVQPNSPAEAAGVVAGDCITAVGTGDAQITVATDGYDAAVAALTGEEGTVAAFTVQRGENSIPFTATRRAITTYSVTGHVSVTDAAVGVVRIMQFDTETPVQFKEKMNQLIAAGCTRFVFDVRNNPGGDLNSITAVLSYFLNKGELVVTTKQTDGTEKAFYAQAVSYDSTYASCSVSESEIGMYRGYPMAVITNKGTASAAELFTAVLGDYQLADIVGEVTRGKGVYQSIIGLDPWGYSGGLRLTVGHYDPPIRENYDGVGIMPTIPTALPEALTGKHPYLLTEQEDTQLQAAIAATVNS